MKYLLAILAGLAAGFVMFDPEGMDKVSNGAAALGEFIQDKADSLGAPISEVGEDPAK